MILDGFVFPGKDTENMKIFRNKEIQMDMDKSLEIEKLELVIVEKIQEIKELEMVVNEKIDDIRKLQMVVDEKNIENEKLKTESIRNLSQISSITETTEEFKEELKQCKIKNKQISEELKKIQDDCSNKSEKIKDLENDNILLEEKLKMLSTKPPIEVSESSETIELSKKPSKKAKILMTTNVSEKEINIDMDECSESIEPVQFDQNTVDQTNNSSNKKASDKIEKKNNKRKRGDETAVISIEAKRSRKCIEEEANDTIKQLKTKTINGEIQNGNDTIEEINDDNNIEVN